MRSAVSNFEILTRCVGLLLKGRRKGNAEGRTAKKFFKKALKTWKLLSVWQVVQMDRFCWQHKHQHSNSFQGEVNQAQACITVDSSPVAPLWFVFGP